MAISLEKGKKVHLEKKHNAGLGEILVNLNWNTKPAKQGFLAGLLGSKAPFRRWEMRLDLCSASRILRLTEMTAQAPSPRGKIFALTATGFRRSNGSLFIRLSMKALQIGSRQMQRLPFIIPEQKT